MNMLKSANNKNPINQIDIQSITYLDEKVNEEESLEDIGENDEDHLKSGEADLSRQNEDEEDDDDVGEDDN